MVLFSINIVLKRASKNWGGVKKCVIILLTIHYSQLTLAQDTVRYTATTLSNVDYHHGQLSPAIGVHNIQIFRANRQHPELAGDTGWTYNHAPMIAYWSNTFYVQYLSNAVGEHVGAGQTLLLHSKDGYNWSKPEVVFPPYKVPDGTTKEGRTEIAKDLYAVMHQRVGFFTSKKGKLLTLGFYGLVMGVKDDPNDGNGIGRVIREINKDGTFGPIYFIRYNHAFNEKNTNYPFYKKAKGKAFVEACEELLASPLQTQQWVEEADRNDPLISLQKDFKAFNYYHLPNGNVAGFWKYALTSISTNGGKTWQYNPTRAPGFVNANAKIWGQKTTDGRYATVYNPSEFRWPLAVSVSDDGLNYKSLLLVNGEIASMRYGGEYKSYGPQYVRGIQEMDGTPPDNNMWVTYSMNKEDIWVSSIPIPVKDKADKDASDDFNTLPAGQELKEWNIYSPLWAKVSIEKSTDGSKALVLKDADPFDYAKAERVIPEAKEMEASFSIIPQQDNHGLLEIELQDAKGYAGIRIIFDSTGAISVKAGYRNRGVGKYKAGEVCNIKLAVDTKKRFYTIEINGGKPSNNIFFAPLASVSRVAFRTGGIRRFPDADTPTDQMYDLPNSGGQDKQAAYYIKSFSTKKIQ
jgi:hypothetical protein